MLNETQDLNATLHRPFQYVTGTSIVHALIILHLLRAYVSVQKFGIICLSETCLDSSVDDESVEISEYYLICSDHPSKKYRFGICMSYNNFLPLKVTGVLL